MRRNLNNQFALALIAYFFFIGLTTIPLLYYFQKIKVANEEYQEKLTTYLNWQFKEEGIVEIDQKVNCEGDLFFLSRTPIVSLHVYQDQLYLSRADGKLTIINLKKPAFSLTHDSSLFTDFYSGSSELFGTEILNDRIVKIIVKDDRVESEEVYDKIGRASALTKDSSGNFYVSGYASGNIIKIAGRDGFLFTPDLDKVSDLEIIDNQRLYVARYNSTPSLLSLELEEGGKTIIEGNKNFSSLAFDGNNLWVAYSHEGKTQIGKIIADELVDNQTLNCQFPLKIAVWQDRLFYVSLADSEGKVYSLNKNLQSRGK